MKACIRDWVTRVAAGFAIILLLYVLTAPPIMMNIARHRGNVSFPAIYDPIVYVIESDFNGPALWYFNDVWHSGIRLMGDEPSTPPRVLVTYIVTGIALVALTIFPIVRQRFRRVRP